MKPQQKLADDIWAICAQYVIDGDYDKSRADVVWILSLMLARAIGYTYEKPQGIEDIVSGLEGTIYTEALKAHDEFYQPNRRA